MNEQVDFNRLSISGLNWSVGLLFLILILGAVVGIVWNRRRPPVLTPVSAGSAHYLGELSWLLAPGIVLATFLGIAVIGPARVSPTAAAKIGAASEKVGPSIVPAGSTVSIKKPQPVDVPSSAPDWLNEEPIREGQVQRFVLSSQQYVTREECEQELLAQTTELLHDDLRLMQPGLEEPLRWKPTMDDLRRSVIKDQYSQVVERDFGTFHSPMNRVWWKLEISPDTRQEFLPVWRNEIAAGRIRMGGVIASAFVLALSLTTIFYRLDSQTMGRRRMWLGAYVTTLGSLVTLGILFVGRHLL
jgi:hypothetical protein